MSQEQILDLLRETIKVSLYLAGPMLGFGVVVGLTVSVLQAVTQINEATLTFVPKILAILAAFIIFMPWMMDTLTHFTHEVFEQAALWSLK